MLSVDREILARRVSGLPGTSLSADDIAAKLIRLKQALPSAFPRTSRRIMRRRRPQPRPRAALAA